MPIVVVKFSVIVCIYGGTSPLNVLNIAIVMTKKYTTIIVDVIAPLIPPLFNDHSPPIA